MDRIRHVAIALTVCSLTAACASAPISLNGSAQQEAAIPTPIQNEVQAATRTLASQYRDMKLIRAADENGAALGWLGRLAGQADATEPSVTPVTRYLDHHDIEAGSAALVTRLSLDVEAAVRLASEVDLAAQRLVAADGGNSRAGLGRSLGRVETAMTQTREALEVVDALIATIDAEDDALPALNQARGELAQRSDALRNRADELAAIRHAAPSAISS
ncbi:hypothetical protein [Maricaulis sp. CAU 1757]